MLFQTQTLPVARVQARFIPRQLRSYLVAFCLLAPIFSGCGQDGNVRPTATSGGEGGGGASTSSSAGGGAQNNPLPLSLLNWNVHNYLNNKDDSPDFAEVVVTTAEYVAHRKAIGAVLAAQSPDIAVLQEVENAAALSDLLDVELPGIYGSQGLIDGNDPRGIDIAVISKIPIDKIVTHKDDSFTLYGTIGPTYRFSRDCPEIHLVFNGRKLILLGTHLKAKANDDPNKRLAEAQHTRAIADNLAKADPTAAIVVLGDFNDTPGSPPYLAVIGSGDTMYKNTPELLPTQDRWSYNYNGKLELVDHQMANPLFAPMLDPMSITITRGNDVEAASDHYPVMATYLVQ